MKKNQSIKSNYPRVYTIHSQKGGVGKTSIAIAIAGLESIFSNKKVLIIDADLTGASLIDILNSKNLNNSATYFNQLILANPGEFKEYTSIIEKTKQTKNSQNREHLDQFYHEVEAHQKISFLPASPVFKDIRQVVPLISQEDHLSFFRHRLEDIIVTAFEDGFDVIIIDHPPGLFGISMASLNMALDQIVKEVEKKGDLTRLDKLYKFERTIEVHPILVTTTDRMDYRALIPAFFKILNIKELEPEKIKGKVNLVVNKAPAERRVAHAFTLQKILGDLESFPDDRYVPQELIKALEERAKEIGAITCEYVKDFDIETILKNIKNLNTEINQGKKIFLGMIGWLRQVGKSVNIIKT